MFVHVFGAYFGLAASLILYRRDASTEKEGSSYQSDMFAMIAPLHTTADRPAFLYSFSLLPPPPPSPPPPPPPPHLPLPAQRVQWLPLPSHVC
ncbi:Ammonium transporter Rh type C [Portunus trituberculatus]|uniref:Ammonium transporter Rh type C n=1 Tax=Portunus trituberculatus TaxID=210409 RepID=A0A5B7J6L5_PORTR|nr:Ammonium transporter Rh type C [Portunus trituberculatus]